MGSISARVLLVEDDADIAQLVDFALTDAGHTVETRADGAAAWERLQQGGLDLVVLDLMLPNVDGLTICQWVRDRLPGPTYRS